MERSSRFYRCVNCGEPFSYLNVFSFAGEVEAIVHGTCEICADALADAMAIVRDGDEQRDNQDNDGPGG
ncbi:MAG TPA: hypothetical protein VJU59_10505 [Paraburkholderia sp.]|uniref:hypothetical protein n=1 Tax=Paraburkholderia sp. TaxID=1926495 RepID=UPI002B45F5AC|nr:hypothetical protein [Paraburkholderia sp.]HKR40087.1 hypothetical protein [Paraburkholderia sp.]